MTTRADLFLALADYLPPETTLRDVRNLLGDIDAFCTRKVPVRPVETPEPEKAPRLSPPARAALRELSQSPSMRGEADPEEFFEDWCLSGEGWTSARELYEKYTINTQDERRTPVSANAFGRVAGKTFQRRMRNGQAEYAVLLVVPGMPAGEEPEEDVE